MAKDFNELFNAWSETYDQTVEGEDIEYKEVFAHYDEILNEVAKKSKGFIVEFGVGTGNLTEKLLNKGRKVYGVEPSEGMRNIARQKLPKLPLVDGNFLAFPLPMEKPDTIVSTYAFHHLTDSEKRTAVENYTQILNTAGKIVFADTVFFNEEAKQEIIKDALAKNFTRLAEDLQTEFYTTVPILKNIFEENGFDVSFKQKNKFVWLIEAEKRGDRE